MGINIANLDYSRECQGVHVTLHLGFRDRESYLSSGLPLMRIPESWEMTGDAYLKDERGIYTEEGVEDAGFVLRAQFSVWFTLDKPRPNELEHARIGQEILGWLRTNTLPFSGVGERISLNTSGIIFVCFAQTLG